MIYNFFTRLGMGLLLIIGRLLLVIAHIVFLAIELIMLLIAPFSEKIFTQMYNSIKRDLETSFKPLNRTDEEI